MLVLSSSSTTLLTGPFMDHRSSGVVAFVNSSFSIDGIASTNAENEQGFNFGKTLIP
jgi:hypothetical protein